MFTLGPQSPPLLAKQGTQGTQGTQGGQGGQGTQGGQEGGGSMCALMKGFILY